MKRHFQPTFMGQSWQLKSNKAPRGRLNSVMHHLDAVFLSLNNAWTCFVTWRRQHWNELQKIIPVQHFFFLNIFSSDVETDESKKNSHCWGCHQYFLFFFGLGAKADVVCHNGKLVCYNWMDTVCMAHVHLVQWTSFAYWSNNNHLHFKQYNIFSFEKGFLLL